MDASEIIKKIQARAVYNDTIAQVARAQPACKTNTCDSITSSCVFNYKSYDDRFQFMRGKAYCGPCSTICYTY